MQIDFGMRIMLTTARRLWLRMTGLGTGLTSLHNFDAAKLQQMHPSAVHFLFF
jgi:hypothetical protein